MQRKQALKSKKLRDSSFPSPNGVLTKATNLFVSNLKWNWMLDSKYVTPFDCQYVISGPSKK